MSAKNFPPSNHICDKKVDANTLRKREQTSTWARIPYLKGFSKQEHDRLDQRGLPIEQKSTRARVPYLRELSEQECDRLIGMCLTYSSLHRDRKRMLRIHCWPPIMASTNPIRCPSEAPFYQQNQFCSQSFTKCRSFDLHSDRIPVIHVNDCAEHQSKI